MGKHRRINHSIPDPLPVRIREWIAKHIVCPIIGHKPMTKFGGIVPCRRHD